MPEVAQQPINPEPVQPQETAKPTETVAEEPQPEQPPEQDSETLSRQAEQEIQEQIESADDMRIVLSIIRQNLTDESFLPLVAKAMTEKYGNGAPSLETLKEVSGLMQCLESSISESDLQKLAEMEKDPKFEGAMDKKNLIIDGLCLPVLKGHLTAEDVASVVGRIALMDSQPTQGEIRASSGYEGVMYYDQENNAVLINPAVLAKKYQDKKGKFAELDIEHMAVHELSHGVAGKTVLANESWEKLDQELSSPNPEFSSGMIKQVRAIIESAEEMKGSQSIHIRNVLEAIKNIDRDYAKLSPEQKQHSGTAEEFHNRRLAQAAVEIITEYTALYLESDGSFKDFARNCLIKTGKKGLEQFLASSLNISAGSEEEKPALVQKKLKSIMAGLSSGSETISTILEQNPSLKRYFYCYKVFYDNISPAVQEGKGSLSEEGDDEFDFEDYDGYYDSAGGFEQQEKGGRADKTSNGVMALIGAFADEVEVTKPITGSAV